MQIRITPAIRDALAKVHDVPDNLRARIADITADGNAFTLKLSDDEATTLAELVQWHIKSDPATDKPTPETKPYDDLIRLIDQAMF